jgi:hypothetical protein
MAPIISNISIAQTEALIPQTLCKPMLKLLKILCNPMRKRLLIVQMLKNGRELHCGGEGNAAKERGQQFRHEKYIQRRKLYLVLQTKFSDKRNALVLVSEPDQWMPYRQIANHLYSGRLVFEFFPSLQ